MWQEHEHCVDEGRVVVNDHDTSVPLKRHLHLQSPLGARRRRPIICVHVRPQLAKGALAAIICPPVPPGGPKVIRGCPGKQGLARYLRKGVLDTRSLAAHTFGGAQAQRGGWGERFLPSSRASRERLWAAERPPESARGSAVPAVSQSLRSSFRSKPQGKWSAKRVSDKPRQTSSGATAKGCRHAAGGSAAPDAPSRQ